MPELENGQLFERYRVRRWSGNGISGESYEAEDRVLQRKVTLKLIHPWAMLADSARRQFFREMQGISLLSHPYLATVLDYGEVEGRMYVARRYVSSGSLLGADGRLWFRPPLPVADVFTYAHQLAQALQYMHQHGYLHGALTFANILVLRGPRTEPETDYAPFLVADAGLAHFVRRFGRPLITTPPVSTAPEQLSQHVAPASDQFALAVLLYFWLAGRPPYLGTSDEIIQQKLSATITPLSTLNPGITAEQESIIRRALAVNPEDRFASILDFGEALLASLTVPTRQFAPPIDTFAQPPETPHELAQVPRDETLATAFKAQTPPADQVQPATPEAPAMESPASSPTESQPSAIEQLLARPRTEPSMLPSAIEAGPRGPEPEATMLTDHEREEFITARDTEAASRGAGESELFPALPETPRREEPAPAPEEISAGTQASETLPAGEENALFLFPIELPDDKGNAPVTPPADSFDNEPSMPANSPAEPAMIDETNAPFSHANEDVLPNTEAVPTTPAVEFHPADEENALPSATAEEENTQETSSDIPPVSASETEITQETEEAVPVEEPHETSSETYPPLDEVIVAPRLLISSPYTHSSYEFLLTGEEITIGRAGSSDLYLEQDDLTSRHHALLKRAGERVLIFDKRSYNGVFVNGQKIEAGQGYELADGDHIGIGNYEIIFRSTPAGHVPQLI